MVWALKSPFGDFRASLSTSPLKAAVHTAEVASQRPSVAPHGEGQGANVHLEFETFPPSSPKLLPTQCPPRRSADPRTPRRLRP